MRLSNSGGRSLPYAPIGIVVLAALVSGCSQGGEPAVEPHVVATVAATGATEPTVALSARTGRSYVAWVGTRGDEYNVYLATAEQGSTSFSTPVRVNDIPGDAAPHAQAPAQVAVGPDEEVYVLWQNNTPVEGRMFPASDLRFAVSTDGGRTFQPAITVNDDAGELPSSHTFHNLAVGLDGTVVVSWIDSREQDRVRSMYGRDTGDEAAAGRVMHGPEIRVARSTDAGRSFSSSVVVDEGSCPCCRTAVTVGPDGSVYVAWRKVLEGDVRDIVVARAAPGALDFADPVRANDDGWVFPGCPHAGPSLVVDHEGRLHIGWYTGREDRQGLWHAVSGDQARSFLAPTPVLTGEWVPPSQIVLARAERGIWVGWEDRSRETATVLLARTADGRSLRPEGGPVAAGRSPALASAGGVAVMAWLDGEAIRVRWAAESARHLAMRR